MNFLALWENKSTIAMGLILAALAWYAWRADQLGDERDELALQVAGYQQVVADMGAWHEATVAALEGKTRNDKERNEFRNTAAARNSADRADGDGPLAPVLFNGLHELGLRQAARKENP